MPFSYEIVPSMRLVLNKAAGVVTAEDLIVAVQQIGQHPDFQPDFNQFYDLTGVDDFQMSSAGVRQLAAANPFGKGSRRALLCAKDLVFGMARMYQMLTDDRDDEFFVSKNIDEALNWLEVSEDEDRRIRQFIGD